MRRILLLLGLSLYVAASAQAGLIVPQSTAFTLAVGPFVDSTDGSTLETGLTINASDVQLSKNGGTYAAKNSGGCTAMSTTGMYSCAFNTTDGNTAGTLQVNVAVAGALPVYHELQVIPAATYAITYGTGATGLAPANVTQVGGSNVTSSGGLLAVNATQISGSAPAADALEAGFIGTAGSALPLGILEQGQAQAAAAGTLTMRTAAPFGDNTLAGATVIACGSTQGYCQANSVASNVGSTDVLTLAQNWPVTPSGTVTYQVFGTAPASGGGGGATAAEVWAYSTRALTAATNITSTGGTIPITASRVDASVGAYQSGSAPLQPTVAGRTLDVTATGGAGVDWANVESPTTTVNLSGTSISTSQSVASVSGTVASVTGAVGSVAGNVGGNVVGTVASVTGNVGGTVNGLTTTAQTNVRTAVGLASANLDTQLAALPTSSANATAVWGAGSRTLTAATNLPSVAQISAGVWDESLTGHTTPGSAGATLSAAAGGGADPTTIANAVWNATQSSYVTAGSTGASLNSAAAGGSSPSTIATAVWANGARTLTAGTNLAIPTASDNATAVWGAGTRALTNYGNGSTFTSIPWNAAWDAEVQSEVTDALNAVMMVQPTGKPAWGSSTVWQGINWQLAWIVNKIQQTENQKVLRNAVDNANIATCATTDNGTTLTVEACTP